MGEIDLMAELDDPCPRGCGRSTDECEEAEDGGQCAGSELVQQLERALAEEQLANNKLSVELDSLHNNTIQPFVASEPPFEALDIHAACLHQAKKLDERIADLQAKLAEAERAFDAAIAQRDMEAKARTEAERERDIMTNTLTAYLEQFRLEMAVVEAAKAWVEYVNHGPASTTEQAIEGHMSAEDRAFDRLASAVDALAAGEINVGSTAPSSNEDGPDEAGGD